MGLLSFSSIAWAAAGEGNLQLHLFRHEYPYGSHSVNLSHYMLLS